MSLMKEYFFNIKCDVCGCLCDDELWNTDIRRIKEIAVETGWIKLGGKDYCQDCWKYDENDNIMTSDVDILPPLKRVGFLDASV